MKRKLETKTLTQRELENGIWQFILDHSRVYGENLYRTSFSISTKDDLMSRIWARASMLYKIKDEKTLEEERDKYIKKIDYLLKINSISNKKESKINKLPKFKKGIIKKLRQLTNYLIKRWTKHGTN